MQVKVSARAAHRAAAHRAALREHRRPQHRLLVPSFVLPSATLYLETSLSSSRIALVQKRSFHNH